jgi:hypothetical protein
MTEIPGRYTNDDGSPFNKQKSPAETTAQSFVEGILITKRDHYDLRRAF